MAWPPCVRGTGLKKSHRADAVVRVPARLRIQDCRCLSAGHEREGRRASGAVSGSCLWSAGGAPCPPGRMGPGLPSRIGSAGFLWRPGGRFHLLERISANMAGCRDVRPLWRRRRSPPGRTSPDAAGGDIRDSMAGCRMRVRRQAGPDRRPVPGPSLAGEAAGRTAWGRSSRSVRGTPRQCGQALRRGFCVRCLYGVMRGGGRQGRQGGRAGLSGRDHGRAQPLGWRGRAVCQVMRRDGHSG